MLYAGEPAVGLVERPECIDAREAHRAVVNQLIINAQQTSVNRVGKAGADAVRGIDLVRILADRRRGVVVPLTLYGAGRSLILEGLRYLQAARELDGGAHSEMPGRQENHTELDV